MINATLLTKDVLVNARMYQFITTSLEIIYPLIIRIFWIIVNQHVHEAEDFAKMKMQMKSAMNSKEPVETIAHQMFTIIILASILTRLTPTASVKMLVVMVRENVNLGNR